MKIDAEARGRLESLVDVMRSGPDLPDYDAWVIVTAILREAETPEPTPTKSQAEALEALDRLMQAASFPEGRQIYQVYTDQANVRRFIEQAGAVPEGWQLVPVEPTREMLLAQIAEPLRDLVPGHEAEEEVLGYERETYRSMLAAAPKQEADHD